MTQGEAHDYALDQDLLDAAGRLGDELAWRLRDGRNLVARLASSHRAIVGGELWVLWQDGPLYDIPRLSQNAPIYAAYPIIDPVTGEYRCPGLYVWEVSKPWGESESWEDYCEVAAREALGHIGRIESLRAEMAPEVREHLWLHLDLATGAEERLP